jgi:putative oxidoreductase
MATELDDTSGRDIGPLVLRLGVGAAILQAGLLKALDFRKTIDFMTDDGWRAPQLAALMVTVAETAGGVAAHSGPTRSTCRS